MLALFLSNAAVALTTPLVGAVSLPSGAPLTLPFPEGTPVAVSCGYSPNCSAFHSGLDETCCTNDYYALDLVRDTVGGGAGEPVLAAADGEVVYADWATGGWSTFGRIVLVDHDFGDGHTYTTLYAHLSSISVSVGDSVSAKDEVGLMGGSGNYGDYYFGAHLHFSLYQDASFIGGPYGGHSTVPEPIDGYEDLLAGDHLTAGAADGAATLITVDDEDPGFALVAGSASDWSLGGYRDHFLYAPAAASPTTVGRWTPTVDTTGLYTVSAYIPYSSYATATLAPFTLHAQGELADDTQDQSIIGGDFHELFGGAAFKLVAGASGYLELSDGSGESASVYVAWDAARFSRVGDPGPGLVGEGCADATACADDLVCVDGLCADPCTRAGCAANGSCDASTGLCDVWADPGTSGSDPTTPSDPGTPGDDDDDDSSPGAPDDTGSSKPLVYGHPMGCGCAEGGAPWSAAGLLALVTALRRRRTS